MVLYIGSPVKIGVSYTLWLPQSRLFRPPQLVAALKDRTSVAKRALLEQACDERAALGDAAPQANRRA
jgi:hypothetical protein